MNNSLSLDSQNLPLLVNFTSEILDSFKPKPQLSRCKFIKAQSLHDSLLTETTIFLQSSSCGKRSKRINIYSSLNKAAFPPTSAGRTIKGFSRTITGKTPGCQNQPVPAQWNLGHLLHSSFDKKGFRYKSRRISSLFHSHKDYFPPFLASSSFRIHQYHSLLLCNINMMHHTAASLPKGHKQHTSANRIFKFSLAICSDFCYFYISDYSSSKTVFCDDK